MNAEKSPKVSMRLYRAAGVLALLSCFLWPLAFLVQMLFVKDLTVSEHFWDEGVLAALEELFDLIRNAPLAVSYDVTHLPGILPLTVLLVLFAFTCMRARERVQSKKRACLQIGVGLECYALFSFACHVLFAVALYYREWSAGVSHDAILRILFTALGSGFAELAAISLFALSLLYVGWAGKNRSLAVAAGAVCIYRLFEDSLWLFTGLFDGTLKAASPYQIAHGVFYLLAMALTLSAAVLVAMSSTKDDGLPTSVFKKDGAQRREARV